MFGVYTCINLILIDGCMAVMQLLLHHIYSSDFDFFVRNLLSFCSCIIFFVALKWLKNTDAAVAAKK